MKICPLEEVECEFKHAGCEAKFIRDEKEEHMREKSQTHLAMLATSLAKMQEGFQKLLLDQEKNFEEKLKAQEDKFERGREQQKKDLNEKLKVQEEKFEKEREQQKNDIAEKLREQAIKFEEKLKAQDKFEREREQQKKDLYEKLKAQEDKFEREREQQKKDLYEKLKAQEEKFEREREQQKKGTIEKLREQEIKFEEKLTAQVENQKKGYEQWKEMTEGNLVENTRELEKIKRSYYSHREFTITIKVNRLLLGLFLGQQWKGPAMYTHLYGYKFYIGIEAETKVWTTASVSLFAMRGEFDNQLKWPVTAEFTIELINHFENGEDRKDTKTMQWIELEPPEYKPRSKHKYHIYSLEHSKLDRNPAQKTHFLKNDTLHFRISDIKILEA